jgi:hypothetical protein
LEWLEHTSSLQLFQKRNVQDAAKTIMGKMQKTMMGKMQKP